MGLGARRKPLNRTSSSEQTPPGNRFTPQSGHGPERCTPRTLVFVFSLTKNLFLWTWRCLAASRNRLRQPLGRCQGPEGARLAGLRPRGGRATGRRGGRGRRAQAGWSAGLGKGRAGAGPEARPRVCPGPRPRWSLARLDSGAAVWGWLMVNRKYAGMCTPSGSEGGGHLCARRLAYDVTAPLREELPVITDSLRPD